MTITIAPQGYDDGNGAELATAPDRVTAFTEEAVREALYAAVEEKGEGYIYPDSEKDAGSMCLYLTYDEANNPTGPSCIVGNVLLRLGVDPATLKDYEGQDGEDVAEAFGIDNRVAQALYSAQGAQDTGSTWGEARAEFERELSR